MERATNSSILCFFAVVELGKDTKHITKKHIFFPTVIGHITVFFALRRHFIIKMYVNSCCT